MTLIRTNAYGAKFSSIIVECLHGERIWRIDFTFNGKGHYRYVRDYEDLFNDLILDLDDYTRCIWMKYFTIISSSV